MTSSDNAAQFEGNTVQDKYSLHGKTALITGSGRGIGRGLALAFAKAGANVIVLDIIEDNIDETIKEIKEVGKVDAFPYVADLSKTEQIEGHVQSIEDQFGHIDILVNNAGIQVRKPALEFTLEEWNRVISIHLTASFILAKSIAKGIIKRKAEGSIINLASLNSFMAVPNIIAYTTAKSGIAGLTRSMAVEWSRYNINVNAIAPGFCRTALTEQLFQDEEKRQWVMSRIPLRRLADPENDLGYVAVFLASKASQYIVGQVIYVDGGWLAS